MNSHARAEELTPKITQVSPGVYRVRSGEPEKIVPSLLKLPSKDNALRNMPTSERSPLERVRVWRLNRGCRVELPLENGEVIYGLGLQCKHLTQNGWRKTLFTMSGDDDGKGMSHAPVPFYVSTKGYGVLVDSARYVTFSVGEEQRVAKPSPREDGDRETKVITSVEELYAPERRSQASIYVDIPGARGVDLYLFAGPTMGEAVARYNLFSGGGCLPSLAELGPEYLIGTMLDSKSALAVCEGIKQDHIPITSVGLEPCWQTHAYSSSYKWNEEKFPPGFPESVRQLGFSLTLWCQAYIDPSSPLVPLLAGNWGDFEVWHGFVPDFANPAVRGLYGKFLLDNFIQKGISGFKLDEVDGSWSREAFGEWMFPEFSLFPSGAEGDQARNLLGRSGTQAIYEAFRKANRRTFGLVRASQAFAAPLPFAIYSDEYRFDDFVRYNLSAGVQGLLWSPEVRHADDERDWARRVAAATFSAKMTFNDWQFPHPAWKQPNLSANEHGQLLPNDNPYFRTARYFSRLRMALLPYLYKAYGDYNQKGIPPVRPLVADWPNDPATLNNDDEWMLGRDLLVAPLMEENAFSEVYQVALTKENQLKPDDGVRLASHDNIFSLDIAGTNAGLPGATMDFDLKPGPCVARLTARGTIERMGLRLRRVEGDRETDVGELYRDDVRIGSKAWQEQVYRFTVPSAGHYRLSVGKGYFQKLPEARRLEIRSVTFDQRQGDPGKSWKREVYLPVGPWRDFWTGTPIEGGRPYVGTATAERPLVFVRDNTLLALAQPNQTMDAKSLVTVFLAAYGDHPRPCELLEDEGTSFDFEHGKWALVTVGAEGVIQRPDHGQPVRYQCAGKAEPPGALLQKLLLTED